MSDAKTGVEEHLSLTISMSSNVGADILGKDTDGNEASLETSPDSTLPETQSPNLESLSTEDEDLLNHCLSTAKVSVINRQCSHSSENSRVKRRIKPVTDDYDDQLESDIITDAALTSNSGVTATSSQEPREADVMNSLLGLVSATDKSTQKLKDSSTHKFRFVLFLLSGFLVRLSFLFAFGVDYVQVSLSIS